MTRRKVQRPYINKPGHEAAARELGPTIHARPAIIETQEGHTERGIAIMRTPPLAMAVIPLQDARRLAAQLAQTVLDWDNK